MNRQKIDCAAFPRTDSGNAELFAALYQDNARYDHRQGRWLFWRGHWWAKDGNGQAARLAKECARARHRFADGLEDSDKRKNEIVWALYSESAKGLRATERLARNEHPLADDAEWDSDPYLLGAANGVVDLHTGRLRDGRPADRVTLHTTIPFDPDAQCPRWERFIEEIFPSDAGLQGFVRRAIGYSLTGETREQCFFAGYGVGANGKSTLYEVLSYVLGDYGSSLPFSAFELKGRSAIPNDVAALVGRRFVTAIETGDAVRLNEARIKALTGGDRLSARFLYQEFFNFYPVAKFWLAFNHRPLVADDSHGFWRRVRLVPFLAQFSGGRAEQDLPARLKEEAPGILAWAVRACLEWQEQGLGSAESVQKATAAYQEESSPFDSFFSECCVADASAWTSTSDLWASYESWAGDNLDARRLDQRQLTRNLERMGFERERRGACPRKRGWKGLKLLAGVTT